MAVQSSCLWDWAPDLARASYWALTLPVTCSFQLWFALLKPWGEHQGLVLALANLSWLARCRGCWVMQHGDIPPKPMRLQWQPSLCGREELLPPPALFGEEQGLMLLTSWYTFLQDLSFIFHFPKRAYEFHEHPMSLRVLLFSAMPTPNQTFLPLSLLQVLTTW